jgi:hypothetical protein
MNTKHQISHFKALAVVVLVVVMPGCVGRTGKVGTPIAARYATQLASLKIGESTPDDLKTSFGEKKLSLKEAKIENGKKIEIWELARGGNMDAAAFLLWGYVAYDKDQSILFRFEDGRLISYDSVVYPDAPKETPVRANNPKW